jgi:hypothetical protein
MVLDLISLATTVPLLATSTIQLQDSAQKHQQKGEEGSAAATGGIGGDLDWKTQTCHLAVRCTERMNEGRKKALNGGTIVLRDGCLFVSGPSPQELDGHPFTGYSLPFPATDYLGLVSTISKDPPMLNWIYIDRETHEVKYGVRKVAEEQLIGPFDYKTGTVSMTITPHIGKVERHEEGEKRIKFRNLEGFVAVEEEEAVWKLYFDVNNDGLKQTKAGNSGKRNAEIELIRVLAEEENDGKS